MKADDFYRDGLLYSIPIKDITPNPKNPRKTFDQEELEKLAQSIREVGILQPLVLTPEDDEGMKLRIVAGERRWRAAQMTGLSSVVALVRKLTPAQEAEIMLIENLQRKDLDPVEEARAYQELLKEHSYTQEALGEKLGVSQGHIANRLRLLRLPDEVRENISRKIISAGHANALLKLEKVPAMMKKAADTIAEEQVPVARATDKVKEVIAKEGRPLFADYNNSPEFKTDGCEKCEFRVMGNRWSYADDEKPYCIKPSCWDKKQQDVRRDRELAVADRVQKMAKKGQGVVELDKLSYNQYEEFRLHKTEDMDLSECENCEHKKVAKRSYIDELIQACFMPSCYKKKQLAATRERNKVARNAMQEELNRIAIMAGLKADSMKRWVPGGDSNKVDTMFVMDKTMLIYIASLILGSLDPLMDRPTLYRYMQGKYGWDNEVLKRRSWGMLNDEWDVFRRLLETLTDQQLLESIFEWPAVARGLEGAAGWMLQQCPAQVPETEPAEPNVYLDEKGRELFVSAGLGGNEYGTFWCSHTGGMHRVKSPAMPMVATREEAQANLDTWAEKKGLHPAELGQCKSA